MNPRPGLNSKTQAGNALFLILIAVALFAALSYAVTQAGRGSGASPTRERAIIFTCQITQYGAQARTAVMRMILSGTSQTAIEFCTSVGFGGFGVCSTSSTGNTSICDTGDACIFTAEGGGVPVDRPDDTRQYVFIDINDSAGLGIEGVGTAATEAVMYVGSLTQTECEEINRQLGLSVPVLQDSDTALAPGATLDDIEDGEPFQCFRGSGGVYTYLHTLIER